MWNQRLSRGGICKCSEKNKFVRTSVLLYPNKNHVGIETRLYYKGNRRGNTKIVHKCLISCKEGTFLHLIKERGTDTQLELPELLNENFLFYTDLTATYRRF